MIKNIVKVLVFLMIFAVSFIKVSYVLRVQVGEDETYIPTYILQPKDSIDVVYIGPSSARRYWAPTEAFGQYGFTSFSFSSNGMPAQVEKYAIIEALKKQSPKLVVVDLKPFENAENLDMNTGQMIMFREAYIRNVTDSVYYSLSRMNAIENVVPEENHRLNYHFDIAKYHTNLTALVSKDNWAYAFRETVNGNDTTDFGGFGKIYIGHEIIKKTDNGNITEELPLSDSLNRIFLDLVSYCANLDTNVMFIIPPSSESEENHQKHNYMNRILDENGIPFLDCNGVFDEIGMDAEIDFYNNSHTNIYGAIKYTKWLGQYLKDTYNLPDRRGDSRYTNWDSAYGQWIIEAGKAEKAVLAKMPKDIQAKVRESRGG